MSVSLQIETPPAAEPITLAQAKSHMRVTIADDDAIIGIYLQAARELYENSTGRSLVNKGYRQAMDAFPYYVDGNLSQNAAPPSLMNAGRNVSTLFNNSQMIKLLRWPLRSVERIDYFASDGETWQYLYPAPAVWEPTTEYEIGDQVTDGTNLQEVTAVAEVTPPAVPLSGSTRPSWASSLNATTTDKNLTWTVIKTTAPTGDFIVDPDSEPARLYPNIGEFWPTVMYVPHSVVIHFTSGYGGDGSGCPATGRVAVLMACANWYQNREPVSSPELKKIPHGLEDLFWTERVIDFDPTRG